MEPSTRSLLVLIFLPFACAGVSCPSEAWTHYPQTGRCYYLVREPASQIECASEVCPSLNASLACIGSAEENTFAASLLNPGDAVWIGLYKAPANTSRDDESGNLRWVNGCDSNFRAWWYLAVPDLQGTDICDSCVIVNETRHGLWWWDIECATMLPCLCQFPGRPQEAYLFDAAMLPTAFASKEAYAACREEREALLDAYWEARAVREMARELATKMAALLVLIITTSGICFLVLFARQWRLVEKRWKKPAVAALCGHGAHLLVLFCVGAASWPCGRMVFAGPSTSFAKVAAKVVFIYFLFLTFYASGAAVYRLRRAVVTSHGWWIIGVLTLFACWGFSTAYLTSHMLISQERPLEEIEKQREWVSWECFLFFGATSTVAFLRLVLSRAQVLGQAFGKPRQVQFLGDTWRILYRICIAMVLNTCFFYAYAFMSGDYRYVSGVWVCRSYALGFVQAVGFVLHANALFLFVHAVRALQRVRRTQWAQERAGELQLLHWRASMELLAIVINVIAAISVAVTGAMALVLTKREYDSQLEDLAERPFGISATLAAGLVAWWVSGGLDIFTSITATLLLDRDFRRETSGKSLVAEVERERLARWEQCSAAYKPCGDEGWQRKVTELAGRGFTLEQLLHFYDQVLPEYMPQYQPQVHRTVDVVREVIIPASMDKGVAYAEKMMSGVPTRPQAMVTHNWSNLFRDLVAAIVADALGETSFALVGYLLDRDLARLRQLLPVAALAKVYWVCAFSVNQHQSICGANPGHSRDPISDIEHPVCTCGRSKFFNDSPVLREDGKSVSCEMNKFADMLALLASNDATIEQIIAVDSAFDLFNRAWCVAELFEADRCGLPKRLKFQSKAVLNNETPRLRHLRVQDMDATRKEDVQEILSMIPVVDDFNEHLRDLLLGDRGLVAHWGAEDAVQVAAKIGHVACVADVLASVSRRPSVQEQFAPRCPEDAPWAAADEPSLPGPARGRDPA